MNITALLLLLQELNTASQPNPRQGGGFVATQQLNVGQPASSNRNTSPLVVGGSNSNSRRPYRPYGFSGRRAPLSLSFTPTQPPFQGPPVLYRGRTPIREYLEFGPSSLVEGCNIDVRIPCSRTPVFRDTCLRWRCCWDPTSSVPCAKSTYYIISLKGPNFGDCGIRDTANLTTALTDPPLLPLLLGLQFPRIIGGTPATDGTWPWMAYIYLLANGIINGGICGGSLLTDQWVLTAAHCIQFPNQPSVYGIILAENRVSVSSGNEVFRTVSRLEVNPSFNPLTFDNDVALLKLDRPVEFNEYIRPVCLVASGTRTDNTFPPSFAGRECYTLGWGHTSSPGGMRSDVLMQLNLTITPQIICNATTILNAAAYNNRVARPNGTKFCAGGLMDEDPCLGDSGGPLVCQHDDGRYYIHGLTSYGTDPCGQPQLPGIYTKLANPSVNTYITTIIGT